MTLGTVMASYELNVRIPAFLSLIGFGNFELSDIARPPLTVIDQPIDEMSQAITELLLSRLRGGDTKEPRTLKMRPSLLMRESIREL
jgi:LacI family transcriptional regulator